MKYFFIVISLMSLACGPEEKILVCKDQSNISVEINFVYKKKEIVVCFDSEEEGLSTDPMYRTMFVDAINRSWNSALQDPNVPEEDWIQLVGFKDCSEVNEYDIKTKIDPNYGGGIAVWNYGSLTVDHIRIGLLNFAINNFYLISVHEVGHALGLRHEHERTDAEYCAWANLVGQGPREEDNYVYYGEYDKDSVMNYCTRGYGKLSDNDIKWIKHVYYPKYYGYGSYCSYKEL